MQTLTQSSNQELVELLGGYPTKIEYIDTGIILDGTTFIPRSELLDLAYEKVMDGIYE